MKQFLRHVLFVCLIFLAAKSSSAEFIHPGTHLITGTSKTNSTRLLKPERNFGLFKSIANSKKGREISINLVKTDESCPNNGTIMATVTGTDEGAVITYEYQNTNNPSNVITSTMPISGLGAGTYRVKAISTNIVNGAAVVEEAVAEITIIKTYKPIQATSTIVNTICTTGTDGQITVNVTAGVSGNKYVMVSAPATYLANTLPYQQSSNVFTGLPAGIYQIQVYDACGLYNTITATVSTRGDYANYYAYFRVSQTDCKKASIRHYMQAPKYPFTITTTITDATNTIVATETDTYTGVTNGADANLIQNIDFTNPAYTYPIKINVTTTDGCGKVRTHNNMMRYNQIALKGICAPNIGFEWDITNWDIMPSTDRDPNAVWPLIISWVNTSNASDFGSETTTGGTPYTGTIKGLTLNATYKVTITDACGHVRTANIVTNSSSNAGQKAWVQVIPGCADGYWIPNYGTNSTTGNKKIDQIKVLQSPAGSSLAVGQIIDGNPTLWSFTGGMVIQGHYVFEFTMGCEVDVVTVDAVGGGLRMTNSIMTPSSCNAADVQIFYSFQQGGQDIPVPPGYSPSGMRYALRDISKPGTLAFVFQASNTFLNVPNGTYDVLLTIDRTPSTACHDKVVGRITVANNGPVINSPSGFRCKSNAASTPFNVVIDAVGTGTLQYAITAKDGVPVSPVVWQTTSAFNNLSDGIYTIMAKDNCTTASTIFSTYSISTPSIRKNNICPAGNGSLVVNFVPGYNYQWFKNGVALADGGNISGTNTYELKFAPFNITAPTDEGTYSVHITYGSCVDETYSIELKNEVPNAGDDVVKVLCYSKPLTGINLTNFLAANAQANGVWSEVNTSGKLNSNIFDPNGLTPTAGPFQFKYTVTGYCNQTDESTISVQFNVTPPPTGETNQEFCTTSTSYTLADLKVTGEGIKWYSDANIATDLPLTTALVSGITYYASQTINGCEGNDRLAVMATLKDCTTDIKIAKTTAQTFYVPGQTVTYTITVSNTGAIDAKDVNIKDVAPSGTSIQSWTATGVPVTSGTGNIDETIPVLLKGTAAVYTIVLSIPSSFTAPLSNSTMVTTPTDPDPECGPCVTPPIQPSFVSDLVISKTDGKTTFTPGTATTYTIKVTNNGPSDATGIIVTDALPTGITAAQMSWTGNGTSGNGALNNTITNLVNGASLIYTVTINVPANFTGNLVNTASVVLPAGITDPDTNNNSATDTDTQLSSANVVTTKTLKNPAQTTYIPGQSVEYVVTVTNNGPSDAQNVVIKDTAPAGTVISSWTASGVGVAVPNTNGTGDINETISNMGNGAVVTYLITVKTPASLNSTFRNLVAVTSATPDPIPDVIANPDPSCPVCIPSPPVSPSPQSDLEITKTDGKTTFTPGTVTTYTIKVTNNGPSDATGIIVMDALPVGITAAQMSWTGNGTSGNGALNNTITSLVNGASLIYTVTINVPASFKGNLINTANIILPAGITDPNVVNNSAADIDTPDPVANLIITKTLKDANQTTYIPGEIVQYLVKVINNGPSDAQNVVIKDTAPAGTVISSWTVKGTSVTPPNASGSGDLNESIAILPNGATLVYEISVKTPDNFTQRFRNLVAVSSATLDPTPDVITDPDPNCPACIPSPYVDPVIRIDLSITKKSETQPVGVGYEYKYTIEVKNNSLFTANGVNVTDILPSEISYISHLVSVGSAEYQSSNRSLNWTVGVIQPGATATLTLTVKSDRSGSIVNTVNVKGNETDPNTNNNTATDIKEVLIFKIPNVITPNGDGKNDSFQVSGLELYPENTMLIFNRWGNEVFHSNGAYQNNWTGEGLNAGTYYYLLKIKDRSGTWQAYKGFITLLKNQ
ncbi:gliding motility-associated C-terminal domain-containing protein [Pedobacter punctiformis]|uniref:Gliding motility-associated C-terminal domain-containing protein n=1 Tax=Pedobacter punctiformis TaxID=3004097 RepID=A0ABT4L854_9SPHI|nr:gliding motility-associated C-terminal domain-containing protein [Pedobacter sp. HCMS5-2]MCZ4244104.1 gliding motility-associated C-terminal domain-containing protein [Pedobacter sp. HCMS5-2]